MIYESGNLREIGEQVKGEISGRVGVRLRRRGTVVSLRGASAERTPQLEAAPTYLPLRPTECPRPALYLAKREREVARKIRTRDVLFVNENIYIA